MKKRNKIEDLPHNWLEVSIDEVIFFQKGKKPKKLEKTKFNNYLPYLDIKAFEKNEIRQYADESSSNIVNKNDIIIVWDGARSGWVAMGKKGALGSTLARLRTFLIKPEYLYYFLKLNFSYINNNTKGVGIPHIDPVILWNIKFPLPPLNEQKRIVEKIDELFSELDNAVTILKKAQQQLKIYRQALLKNAFEGKLTEQWRKENNPEPAEKLLERIKQERQKRYEKELAEWKKAVKEWEKSGKKGKKPRKPVKLYDNNVIVNFNKLPRLPSGWKWVKNIDLLYYVTSGSRDWKKYYSNKGAYFIRTQDIKHNSLEIEKAAFVDLPKQIEGKRSLVEKGDLLMTITGANVGKVAFVQKDIPESYVSQSVALMKLVDSRLAPFLHLYFQSNFFGKKFIENMVYGVGRPVLSLENMKEVFVVLCSIGEQNNIVSILNEQFSIADNLEKTIEQALKQSETLRQSILKKAFEGKLVPQDANDEPASKLLERIKVEKEKYLQEQKTKKKKPVKRKSMSKKLSIEEILKNAKEPVSAKDVWQQSKHKDDIEAFYAELKKIQHKIKEIKKGTESLLELKK